MKARRVEPEDVTDAEWAAWYRLSPAERWRETLRLWETYLALGGSLDPEPDTQSPFFDPEAPGTRPVDGRTGLRVIRRGGV
jgi:hypothetical protein